MAPGRIELVATPIGNLADLSPRAREVLATADIIAAEDTRHTAGLLRQIGVQKPLLSLHEHNEGERLHELLERARQGALIAVVSDAGTPLVSDPGFLLLRARAGCRRGRGCRAGPSAVLMALALVRSAGGPLLLRGLPAACAARARRDRLRGLAGETRTMVFFEAPHRIVETLEDMAAVFEPERAAAVARELTKAHESVYRGALAQLLQIAGEEPNFARGEITLVVAGRMEAAPDDAFVLRALRAAGRRSCRRHARPRWSRSSPVGTRPKSMHCTHRNRRQKRP